MKAFSCAGGVENLIVLDLEKYKPRTQGVTETGVSMGSQHKWRPGELEFESLMRMLDNLVSACVKDTAQLHFRPSRRAKNSPLLPVQLCYRGIITAERLENHLFLRLLVFFFFHPPSSPIRQTNGDGRKEREPKLLSLLAVQTCCFPSLCPCEIGKNADMWKVCFLGRGRRME